MSIENIKNFIAVDERIGTAGQPTAEEVRAVARAGYQAIINLGLLDPRYCLPDEAALVTELGLEYLHIPVRFDAPTTEDFTAFVKAMDLWQNKRVFVHCASNYRVSSFIALYAELFCGWTREQADAHIARVWTPNEIWAGILRECRGETQRNQS